MYAVKKSRDQQRKCRPNIFPCRINYNGQVNASLRYWSPNMSEDGKMVSYFRGRKLLGRIVKVPKGCKGVILSSSDRKLPKEVQTSDDHNPDEDERVDDVGILEEQANFDEVIIWGHEALPDKLTDPYVRGMEEWIALAEQIHSYHSRESED